MFELGFLLMFLALATIGFRAGSEIRSITGFGDTPFDWRTFPPAVQDTFLRPLFQLPGQGEPGSECGTATTFICLNKKCGKLFSIPAECNERQCPHCSYLWARKEARIMKGRVWDGRDYYRERGTTYRLHHIIVSYRIGIPDDGNAYRNLRRDTYKLAGKARLDGGCIVFHPWRENRDKLTYDVVGPHFHIFGLGKRIRPSTEVIPYDEDIVFKRVRHFNAKQMDPWEYVLNHCGIMKGTHAVVWFGNLAYNKMEKGYREERAGEKSVRTPLCPYCGSASSHVSEPRHYKPEFWIEPKVM